ncbi:hypothetical protein G0U57_020414, partial [Chelydra serpentina]
QDLLRVRREDKPPPPPRSKFCPGCYSPLSKPGEPARVRRQVEKQKRPRPWRPGSLSHLRPAKVEGPALPGRGRRAVEGTQPRTLKPKPPRLPCSGCYSPLVSLKSPLEEVKDKLSAPKLPCPGCHGSVATGQEGRSAEGILSPRTRRENERPTAAKRKAKQRARDRLYCAGCYSSLTLRDQPAPSREQADGGSSGD